MTQFTEWAKPILGALGTIAGLVALACGVAWFSSVVLHARDHDPVQIAPEPVRVLSNEEIMIAPLHTTSDLPKRDGGKVTNLSTRSHDELVARMDGLADQLAALNQHVFADEQRLKQIEMRLTQIQAAQVQQGEALRKARTP